MSETCLSRHTLHEVLGGGVKRGDALLVHASLGAIGWLEDGPQSLIDILLDLVGEQGHLVMPTASRSFATTGQFDVKNTPSDTGLLSEQFRKMDGVERSTSPMASFAAWGRERSRFVQHYNNYLEAGSPFSALLEMDGKIMLYGVDYDRCTLYHLAEERTGADYNFYKTFSGDVITMDGTREPIAQTYYVRKDMAMKKDARPVGIRFEATAGVYKRKLGQGVVRVFSAREFDAFCMAEITRNPSVFIADDCP